MFTQVSRRSFGRDEGGFSVIAKEHVQIRLKEMEKEESGTMGLTVPDFIHQPVSQATLMTGLQVEVHIDEQDSTWRRYVVKLKVQRTGMNLT